MDTSTAHMITVLVIPPGDVSAYLMRSRVDLAALQSLVGGFLQPLNVTSDAVLYLDEEGKYAGRAVNGSANKIVALADVGLAHDDFIVGQVVVVGVLDGAGRMDGNEHDVPASMLDLCARAGVAVADRTDA